MWTVIEQPFALVPGLALRHLVEIGEQETACGQPVSGQAQEVAAPWRHATDRCPACEQVGGAHGVNV